MSYHVKQNLFLILPTEAKLGDPQLGRKQTVRGPSVGHEVPPRDVAVSWQTPRMCLAQIWQEHENSRQCPLGEAAAQQCTGFLTFNFSQIPPSQWGMQTPSWAQGAAPRDSTRDPLAPNRGNEDLCPDTTVPKTAGKGMLRLGFKLKFSFQGLWKSLPG